MVRTWIFLISILPWQALAQNGFALVELYTSQGCSSCPAADRLLSELVDNSMAEGDNVIALSFHVDYWNYIGWKDPYSNQFNSQRQRNYSKGISGHRVYTPQMIVNGEKEFVGSSRSEAEKHIRWAVEQKPRYQFSIKDLEVKGDKVGFTYEVDHLPATERLNVALVERHLVNHVPRGENAGKTLKHDNVVRAFESMTLKKSGSVHMQMKDAKIRDSAIILYIQDEKMKILGAHQLLLNESH